MGKIISISFVVLLLSVLSACFYSDNEIYYVEPVAGDPPLTSIVTNLDTLVNPPVNDSLEVNYQVEVDGGEFFYIYADVLQTTVYASDSSSGSFWIPSVLADSSGVDTLYLEYYYSSNTNSLADRVGYEALSDTMKYAIDFNLEAVK